MNNRVVESIMLFGDDSIRFANSLINPSKESVNTHLNIMNLINQNIELCVDNNGFDVEINDLDLSFINDPIEQCNIDFEVEFEIEEPLNIFCNNDNNDASTLFTLDTEISDFSHSNESEYLVWAA